MMPNNNLHSNNHFYDHIAGFYDTMVSFDKLVENRINFLANFSKGYNTALDIGCGTGADTIALSKLGLKVTGIDPSAQMVEKAKNNCEKYSVKPRLAASSIIDFYHGDSESYDVIISMGNTFANITYSDLKEIFAIIYEVMHKGGTLVFQILNYMRVMAMKDFTINKYEDDKIIIERKYVKSDDLIFNISVTDKTTSEREEFNTTIYPHIYPILVDMCINAGFSRVSAYGSDKFENFNEINSKDLIIKTVK